MNNPIVVLSKVVAKQVVAALLLAAAGSALAAQDAPTAPQKVAVLDMAGALFNSDKAKAIDKEVQAQTADDQVKLRALAEEANTLQEKRKKDDAVMSADEKRKIEEQIQEKAVQFQYLRDKVQKVVEERRQQFQQAYQQNLIQAIQAVIEEGKYDMVFQAGAVLHYTGSYDITAKVTEKLNAQK